MAQIILGVLPVAVRDKDWKLLYTVMESAGQIWSQGEGGRKRGLSRLLADGSQLWKEAVHMWKGCIEEIIGLKIHEAENRGKPSKGFFGGAFKKKLKGLLPNKDSKIASHQNLIFNELSRFVQYFINFGLPYDHAN